jgi:hypothetical protein
MHRHGLNAMLASCTCCSSYGVLAPVRSLTTEIMRPARHAVQAGDSNQPGPTRLTATPADIRVVVAWHCAPAGAVLSHLQQLAPVVGGRFGTLFSLCRIA